MLTCYSSKQTHRGNSTMGKYLYTSIVIKSKVSPKEKITRTHLQSEQPWRQRKIHAQDTFFKTYDSIAKIARGRRQNARLGGRLLSWFCYQLCGRSVFAKADGCFKVHCLGRAPEKDKHSGFWGTGITRVTSKVHRSWKTLVPIKTIQPHPSKEGKLLNNWKISSHSREE